MTQSSADNEMGMPYKHSLVTIQSPPQNYTVNCND